MKNTFKKLEEEIDKTIKVCKGLFFRGSLQTYTSNSKSKYKIAQRIELQLLRKMSCKGCETCGWFWDYINENIETDYLNFDGIEHGKIYIPSPVTSTEWESGITDIDYIEFKECKNKH